MATCPYCKEDIATDALKCRHCQSMLYPVGADGNPSEDQVTYILDRGFLRFFKFCIGILAIFVVFGMFAFGYDLKDTADELVVARNSIEQTVRQMEEVNKQMSDVNREMNDAKDSQRLTQQELNEVQEYIKTSKKEMDALKAEVGEMLQEARSLLGEIAGHKAKGETLISQIELYHKKVIKEPDARVTLPITQAGGGRNSMIQKAPSELQN